MGRRRNRRYREMVNLDHIEDSIGRQLKSAGNRLRSSGGGSSSSSRSSSSSSPSSSYSSSSSRSYTKTPREPEVRKHRKPGEDKADKEPTKVEPAYDKNGEVLSVDDILDAMAEIGRAKLDVDNVAQRTAKDPEQQANRVRNLMRRYDARFKELEELLKKAKAHEAYERGVAAFRNYGLSSDEANEAVTNLMDETVDWFFERVDDLKDEVSDRIRAGLDGIDDPDINATRFRERLYEELVRDAVIESWEPMEF